MHMVFGENIHTDLDEGKISKDQAGKESKAQSDRKTEQPFLSPEDNTKPIHESSEKEKAAESFQKFDAQVRDVIARTYPDFIRMNADIDALIFANNQGKGRTNNGDIINNNEDYTSLNKPSLEYHLTNMWPELQKRANEIKQYLFVQALLCYKPAHASMPDPLRDFLDNKENIQRLLNTSDPSTQAMNQDYVLQLYKQAAGDSEPGQIDRSMFAFNKLETHCLSGAYGLLSTEDMEENLALRYQDYRTSRNLSVEPLVKFAHTNTQRNN